MPVIKIKNGPNMGKVFPIGNVNITIGRDDNQTIQVLDQGVSRQHAEIFRIGEMCFVRDLDSTNGTFVNNNKVMEDLLRSTDEVLIGSTILVFEDKSASTIFHEPQHVEMDGKEDDAFSPTVEIRIEKKEGKAAPTPLSPREVESRNLSASYEIGKLISTEKDPHAMFQKILNYVVDMTDAANAYILLSDRKTGRLVAKAVVEKDGRTDRKVSRTIVKRVMESGKPLLSADAAMDERFSLSESVILKRIKSVIAAPLIVRDKIEGLIYLHDKRTGMAFTQADLELLASASIHLGMAISTLSSSGGVQRHMINSIKALVRAIEIIEPKTQGHAERVANYSVSVSAQMGLSQHDIQNIRLASLLHDVGKIAAHHAGIDKEKNKDQHVALGVKILSEIEGFEEILPGIKYHHEKANGTGFPYGIKNEATPLMARIIIVTNTFDNMCTIGGVRGEGIPVKEALIDIGRGSGTEFDRKVVDALLVAHRNGTLYTPAKETL